MSPAGSGAASRLDCVAPTPFSGTTRVASVLTSRSGARAGRSSWTSTRSGWMCTATTLGAQPAPSDTTIDANVTNDENERKERMRELPRVGAAPGGERIEHSSGT